MRIFIVFLILAICLPFILKKGVNEELGDSEYVVVDLGKEVIKVTLFLLIFMTLFNIFALFAFKGQPGVIIGYVIFFSMWIGFLLLYLLCKNKKVIYSNENLVVYNIFCKKTIYSLKDIKIVDEQKNKGMIIIFNNNKKLKIEMIYNNYDNLKNKFIENGIKIRES